MASAGSLLSALPSRLSVALADASSRLAGVSHAAWCDAFAALGAATFPLLFFVSAPYGKTYRTGWGPALGGRRGWFVQEIISPITLLLVFYLTQARLAPAGDPLPLKPQPVHVFLFMWSVHYAHRAVLYPLQRSMSSTTLPVVATAVLFNLINGALVGHELAMVASTRLAAWNSLASARVLLGLLIFALGAALNVASDARLRALRARPGDKSYYIPRGGLFEWVACPHYLGEITEWSGWALATGTRSGVVFAFWTFANLAPRAWTTRAWYRTKFREFPANRRCLIPYLF